MNRSRATLIGLAACLGGLGGCPTAGTLPVGGGDNDGGGTGRAKDCPPRNSTSLPVAQFVRARLCATVTVDPPDSSLAKVLVSSGLCADPAEGCPGELPNLIEIDDHGNVVAIIELQAPDLVGRRFYTRSAPPAGARLILSDGCVNIATAQQPSGPPLDSLDYDPTGQPDTGCGEGNATIDAYGVVSEDRSAIGPTVCVRVRSPGSCVGCGQTDGISYVEVSAAFTFEALGSIDNVRTDDWSDVCGGNYEPVGIREGDRLTVTLVQRLEYAPSGSPEELGYQPASGGGPKR